MRTTPLARALAIERDHQLSDACIAAARMTTPLTVLPGGSAGSVILQYMPPGRQVISPFVDGKPMEMEVDVTPAYADVFESANQELLARARAGTGDEPFTDFNHNDDAASSRPQRYFWGGNDPKKGGVLLETRLTASGKAGITAHEDTEPDYTRFSPQWVFHRKTFEPLGLPVNQGAFVNRAAFKTIGKLPIVSAADANSTWALGSAADSAGARRNGDQAAGAAMMKTAEAYQKSKTAHTYGVGHAEARTAHLDAASAHEDAADRFDVEGRAEEAQQERALAKVHTEAADRHKTLAQANGESCATARSVGVPGIPASVFAVTAAKALGTVLTKVLSPLHRRVEQIAQARSDEVVQPEAAIATGRAKDFGFAAQARLRAKDDNISLAQAASALAHEQPQLYKAFLASFRKPGDAAPANAAHPFLVKARAIAQARGLDMREAQQLAARQDYELYKSFIQGCVVSAKGSLMAGAAAPDKVIEFVETLNELVTQGKSFETAISIIGYRRPDLAEAYRLSHLI